MARQVLAFSLVLVAGILIGIGLVVGPGKQNAAPKPESPFITFNRDYTNATDELMANLSADSTVAGVDKAHQILKQRKVALNKQVAQLRTLNPSEFSKDLEEFMENNTANRERLSKFLNDDKKLGKSLKKNAKLKIKLKELLDTYSSIIN